MKPIYLNMKLNDNFNKNDSIKKDISSNDCIPIIIEEKKNFKIIKKIIKFQIIKKFRSSKEK